MVSRLGREGCPGPTLDSLEVLASSGQVDQDLLDEGFTGLGQISLVRVCTDGLAVSEPYRTLFDHDCRWRRPLRHHRTVARTQVHNRELTR